MRLPAEPHQGGTGLEARLPAEPPGPSPSHPRGRGPPPEKLQGLLRGRGPQVRDVEAPGPDWLEGPENLRARKKPRAGGSPHPLQDPGLVLLPFRHPRFPLCTLGDWAELGGDAGGRARARSRSLRSASGSQASTFTFRRPRGLCASEPRRGQHSWSSLGRGRGREAPPGWGRPEENWAVGLWLWPVRGPGDGAGSPSVRFGHAPGLRCAAGGLQAHLGAPLFAHSIPPLPGSLCPVVKGPGAAAL